MTLHKNGAYFCDILKAVKGDREGIDYQFGQTEPLNVVTKIYLQLTKAPDLVAMGVRYYVAFDDTRLPIEILDVIRSKGEIWIECYRVA